MRAESTHGTVGGLNDAILSHYGCAYAIDLPVATRIAPGVVAHSLYSFSRFSSTRTPKEDRSTTKAQQIATKVRIRASAQGKLRSEVQRFAQTEMDSNRLRAGIGRLGLPKHEPTTLNYFSGTSLSALAIKEC